MWLRRVEASAPSWRRSTAGKGAARLGALRGGAANAGAAAVSHRLGRSWSGGRSRGGGGLDPVGEDQGRRAASNQCRRSRGAAAGMTSRRCGRREVRQRAGGAIWGGTGDECVGRRLSYSARAREVNLACTRPEEFRIKYLLFVIKKSFSRETLFKFMDSDMYYTSMVKLGRKKRMGHQNRYRMSRSSNQFAYSMGQDLRL
jgi:hypothetical protein